MEALEFKLSGEFGMFRRPEKQKPALTFSLIPKSAVLGVCGAILGLEGYTSLRGMPEFWDKLQHLKVAISPLSVDGTPLKQPVRKIFVKYLNYHGYGNVDGPDILEEQILVRPAFMATLLGTENDNLFSAIKKQLKSNSCVFRPYLGKNEFLANVEFVGEQKAEGFAGNKLSCSSIYTENPKYEPGVRATAMKMWSYLIRDDFSRGLDEFGRHIQTKVCYHDGEIVPDQADPNAGRFYKLESGKTIFAF